MVQENPTSPDPAEAKKVVETTTEPVSEAPSKETVTESHTIETTSE